MRRLPALKLAISIGISSYKKLRGMNVRPGDKVFLDLKYEIDIKVYEPPSSGVCVKVPPPKWSSGKDPKLTNRR